MSRPFGSRVEMSHVSAVQTVPPSAVMSVRGRNTFHLYHSDRRRTCGAPGAAGRRIRRARLAGRRRSGLWAARLHYELGAQEILGASEARPLELPAARLRAALGGGGQGGWWARGPPAGSCSSEGPEDNSAARACREVGEAARGGRRRGPLGLVPAAQELALLQKDPPVRLEPLDFGYTIHGGGAGGDGSVNGGFAERGGRSEREDRRRVAGRALRGVRAGVVAGPGVLRDDAGVLSGGLLRRLRGLLEARDALPQLRATGRVEAAGGSSNQTPGGASAAQNLIRRASAIGAGRAPRARW